MTDKPKTCSNYTPWTDHGLQITQCLEFWEGQCGESLSPHYKQDCPWPNGYPVCPDQGEGRWKAPLKKIGEKAPEQTLVENVAKLDNQVED